MSILLQTCHILWLIWLQIKKYSKSISPGGQNKSSYAAVASNPANVPVKLQLKPIVGRSRTVQNGNGNPAGMISAAEPFISKATVCVDNVSISATEDLLTRFVTVTDIDVLGYY